MFFSVVDDENAATTARSEEETPAPAPPQGPASSSAALASISPSPSPSKSPAPKKLKKRPSFVTATSKEESEVIATQWANFFYSSRIPFLAAENPEFKKAMEMTRPGFPVEIINRHNLGGKLLDEKFDEIEKKEADLLGGRKVVISQDGWSNLHNQPIIATALHFPGKSLFLDAVDVGAEVKSAEYCFTLIKNSIESVEKKYGCTVVGFVSDNENKMVKVRQKLLIS